MKFDLNCDLGEGEARARTEALMRQITSANIACGGHAGDVDTMERCVRLAKRHNVRVGAHPGSPDRMHFGRGEANIGASELELLLLHQVGALERIAKAHNMKLHHIKLHGALYHATEGDERLARAYLRVVRRWWPDAVVYALAKGTVARLDKNIVWEEGFLDRNYAAEGGLVPRRKTNALLRNLSEVRRRISQLTQGSVLSVDGKPIPVKARTICLHSDTPRAIEFAQVFAMEKACERATGVR